MGRNNLSLVESTPWSKSLNSEYDMEKINQDINAIQAISWWMIKNGENI